MPLIRLSPDLVKQLALTNPQKLVGEYGRKQGYVNRISKAFAKYGDVSLSQARGKPAKSESSITDFLRVGQLPRAREKAPAARVNSPRLPYAPLPYTIERGNPIPTLNGGDIQYVDVIFDFGLYDPESDDFDLLDAVVSWFQHNYNRLKTAGTRVRFGYLLFFGIPSYERKGKSVDKVRTKNLQISRLHTQSHEKAMYLDSIITLRCVMKQEYRPYVD